MSISVCSTSSSSFPLFALFPHTGTPGLSTGLVTSLLAHGVWLALVLGHTGVDGPALPLVFPPSSLCTYRKVLGGGGVLDNVRADGGLEDIWERVGVLRRSTVGANDGHGRSGGHCEGAVWLVRDRRPRRPEQKFQSQKFDEPH